MDTDTTVSPTSEAFVQYMLKTAAEAASQPLAHDGHEDRIVDPRDLVLVCMHLMLMVGVHESEWALDVLRDNLKPGEDLRDSAAVAQAVRELVDARAAQIRRERASRWN